MPHLQEKVDEKNDHGSRGGPSMSCGSDLPITEAKEGFLEATEGLLTMKKMNSASGPPRAVSEDASFTPQTHSAKQSVITPSPYGFSKNQGIKYGPMVTIFGNKKLVPSPIRVKRRVSNSEDYNDEDALGTSNSMGQPTNLRYAEDYSTPSRSRLTHTVSEGFETDEPTKKRLLGQLENGEESVAKKTKLSSEQSHEDQCNRSAAINTDASLKIELSAGTKKPVISPTSSGEKGEDDEIAPSAPPSGAYPPYAHHGFNPQPYAPRRHPYPPSYGQPPYAGGFPMYNGYPPPPPPHHFAGGPSSAPPFYPPYPPHHPAMMRQFSRPMPPHPFPGSPHRMMQGRPAVPPGEMPRNSPPPQEPGINSVADWRRAAMSNGKPPSANRCVPLKEPIPSKYWGNAERTKDAILPDFHRLVNFPDYLVKSRNSSNSEPSNQTPTGKKNCVMCGKLRVCSATSFVGRGRGAAVKPDVPSSSSSTEEDECSAHIIPRQNKGLCTACDITVWVLVADQLEIKWCKGCKNFRPWAAFGDKGSATKCVRCRDRQREKYAMQKDEIKQRKHKRTSASEQSEPSTPTKNKDDERTHLAAAHGLRTLMNASAV